MGDTCSACQTKSSSKTEIVHVNLSEKDNYPSFKDISNNENVSQSQSNTKSLKNGKSNKEPSNLFEIKYTHSFSQSSFTPTADMRESVKTKPNEKNNEKSSSNSVNSAGLRQIKGKYLDELFVGTRDKIVQQSDKMQKRSSGKLSVPSENVPETKLKRLSSTKSQNNRIDREQFIRISHQNINQNYVYHTKIGEGAFGFVYKGYDITTKEQRAVKIIKKRRLTQQRGGKQALFAELEILREIDHPNIIKLYDVIENKNIYYVVTEYCEGGQLLDAIRKVKHFTEGHVAHIMTQIMSAVNYLEKKGIIHRDLKPENIVLEFKSTSDNIKQPPIKIIDFGTATYFKPGQKLKTQIGSPYYIAPEVIKQDYNQKCDVWSCGVIMYVLLCGYPPFRGRTQKDIFECILKGKIVMQGGIWAKISAGAKDLLKQMLEPNPARRISAEQVMKHKWMTQYQSNNLIEPQVLNNMEKFFFKDKFRAVIETFLAMKTISQEDRRSLADKFKELDKDNSGVLQMNEVLDAFKSIYVDTSEEEVKKILDNIDTDHSGHIELTEFIVATIQHQKLYKRKALENAWTFFDKDKTGYLDMEELGLLIGDSTESELEQIMNELGAEGGQISKQRFMRVFESKYNQ